METCLGQSGLGKVETIFGILELFWTEPRNLLSITALVDIHKTTHMVDGPFFVTLERIFARELRAPTYFVLSTLADSVQSSEVKEQSTNKILKFFQHFHLFNNSS